MLVLFCFEGGVGGRLVLGPGGAAIYTHVLVVHGVSFPETLGDSEDVLLLTPLDVDVVEGVFE
jgi:hypothetical protein